MTKESMEFTEAWYCVQAKIKTELIVARQLSASLQLETWSPTLRYRKSTRRGMIWYQEALFPTYFFAKFNPAEHLRKVQYSRGVTKIIRFGDQIKPVPDLFIQQLREEMVNEEIHIIPTQFSEGDEVEITEGSMKGLNAQIQTILPAQERVKILLDILGDTREIDVPMSILHPTTTLRDSLYQNGHFLPTSDHQSDEDQPY